MPAVFALADERVHQVGTGSYVQHLDVAPTGDLLVVVAGKQVRQMVDIVDTTGNWRAQIAGGNIPEVNLVVGLEQRLIERAHRLPILENRWWSGPPGCGE